jgi:multicomponent Na+:H+ antiporter subunit F
MIYAIAAAAILVTMGLALVRALLGPTVFDRILAVNMFGTKTVLLIAVFAFMSGRTDIIDIALIYALINFIGVVAVLKLVEQGNFHTAGEQENPPCGQADDY